jgi:hypothetical protein
LSSSKIDKLIAELPSTVAAAAQARGRSRDLDNNTRIADRVEKKCMSSSQLIANHFEIQDLLGRSGMGEVYRVTDAQTSELVAVKALNPRALARLTWWSALCAKAKTCTN